MTDTNEHHDASGLPARAAALDLLIAALGKRAGVDEGLNHPALAALAPRDRAFARAVVMATLRRLGAIDNALQGRLKKPPPEIVVQILRLAVAQIFILKTPPHAAVTTAVDLTAKVAGPLKGLVNAVLRGMLREPPEDLDDPDLFAPQWLYMRWQAAFGIEEARKLAAVIAEEPATDLSLKDTDAPAALVDDLEARPLPGGSLRTDRRGDVALWPGFAEGLWWVQDASAAIPARLLAAQPGETALDLCAAPGGKTLQLAAAGATVTAVDRSAPRLKRVTENFTPHRPGDGDHRRRRRHLAGQADLRRRAAGRALLGHRHIPPPSRRAVGRQARRYRQPGRRAEQAAGRRRPQDEARRADGLLRLLAGARGGRGPGRSVPEPHAGLQTRPDPARRRRRAGRQPEGRWHAAHPAPPSRRRDRRLLRGAAAQGGLMLAAVIAAAALGHFTDPDLAHLNALPRDVRVLIDRKISCEHWAGEEPYDAGRRREIEKAVRELRCDSLERDEARLRRRYAGSKPVLKAIGDYPAAIE